MNASALSALAASIEREQEEIAAATSARCQTTRHSCRVGVDAVNETPCLCH
jgi:hypothetical protein